MLSPVERALPTGPRVFLCTEYPNRGMDTFVPVRVFQDLLAHLRAAGFASIPPEVDIRLTFKHKDNMVALLYRPKKVFTGFSVAALETDTSSQCPCLAFGLQYTHENTLTEPQPCQVYWVKIIS